MKRLILFTFLLPSVVLAADEPCSMLTAQDVLACALRRHPDIVRAEAELRTSSTFQRAARQIPNPEFAAESASFTESDQPATKLAASYQHTFELGGKRAARVQEGAARLHAAQAKVQLACEQVALATVLHLHRLRQLRDELRLVDEAMDTFKEIVISHSSRPRRSAEQDVSLSVFRMAQSDYEFRKSLLLQERAELESYFRLAVQAPLDKIVPLAPLPKEEWPLITGGPVSPATGRVQESQAALAAAEANLRHAKSDAWPDVRLGPRLEREYGHGQDAKGYGAALSLSLPLYHRNRGALEAAQAGTEQAAVSRDLTDREIAAEYERWFAVYQEAVRGYQAGPRLQMIEKHHKETEDLFKRGLVQPALIIEAHRQMVDLAKMRHEQERRALEALWKLRALQGRLREERL